MKVYNQEKTKELFNVDLTKGYLIPDKIFIKHIDEVQEQGHYETIKEYENGGKDVEWVVDVPRVVAQDVYEDIQVYVEYTEQELAQQHIGELKQILAKYKEDVEQVELFDMERADYADKKKACADIILQLRELEKNLATAPNGQ